MHGHDFYHWQDDALILNIRLQPKASHDRITGPENGFLKIRITSPPVDGKANKHLIELLAKLFRVPTSAIELVAGESAREKRLCIKSPRSLPDYIMPCKK